MKGSTSDIRGAVLCYQYSERIKSELIIGGKLLEVLIKLKNDQLFGAEKVVSSFLDALTSEAAIAYNITRSQSFREASLKIVEAQGRISLREYSKAGKLLSEALSHVTTGSQKVIQLLIEKGCL